MSQLIHTKTLLVLCFSTKINLVSEGMLNILLFLLSYPFHGVCLYLSHSLIQILHSTMSLLLFPFWKFYMSLLLQWSLKRVFLGGPVLWLIYSIMVCSSYTKLWILNVLKTSPAIGRFIFSKSPLQYLIIYSWFYTLFVVTLSVSWVCLPHSHCRFRDFSVSEETSTFTPPFMKY